MDEFALISRYFARAGADASVRVGIGDDCAVMSPSPGCELVAATDTLVQGVHYPETLDPYAIGWRAVMVNLSDFAAMGARPRWMTMALTLTAADAAWLDGFAQGLFAAAATCGVDLVGGDTTRGGNIVISLQVIGEVPAGEALLRSGASPGETIYVTGTPGDAAAGLEELTSAGRSDDLADRFRKPVARVAYGLGLRGIASSAIDLSDGLYADLGKLLAASGAGGRLDLDSLPLSAALRARYPRDRQIEFALSGGDDYELCFTAPTGSDLPTADHAVTAIGTVVAGSGIACFEGGAVYEYASEGYLHFS